MKNGAVCCFTGHRNIDARHEKILSSFLDSILDRLIAQGFTEFRAGGALGFDTIVALKVIEKKKQNKNIRLHLFLPCKSQADKWSDEEKATYLFTIQNADEVTYTSQTYTTGCMLHRNRCLVSGSDICVGYCLRSSGGTAYTLNYAKKQNVHTMNIAYFL